ncbi:MAG: oligo-alginate lyase, partial [Pseudonocardiales bacterium]|nr:oligo-alginate lyase [Pseudonocardiales bacterium]
MASLTGSVSSGGTVVEVPAIPDRRGGWWHEYVCPTHGTELLPARDQVFPCPHGCELTGEPYAGAWTVLAHQAAARSLRRLAVRAR